MPTIWGMIIGGPSTYKTPMMSLGLAPLNNAQLKVINVQNLKNQKKQQYLNEKTERERCELEEKLKIAIDEDDNGRIEELLNLITSVKPCNKSSRDIVLNDATPEAVVRKLQDNPLGILLFRDELNALFSGMNKQGREQERALYLEGFNASGSRFVQERMSRENIELESVHINILGGIQPKILVPLLMERASGRGDDGLFERFQLAVYPCIDNTKYTDIVRTEADSENVYELFNRIAEMGNEDPTCFNFSEEAQNLWDQLSNDFHQKVNSLSDEEQAIEIKYPALVAKLSLVFQLALNAQCESFASIMGSRTIDILQLEMALKWLKYLRSHSAKIRALIPTRENHVTSLLCNLSKLNGAFTKQELGQKDWKYLKDVNERNEALRVLEDKGYIKLVKKPRKMYLVHPDYR